MLVALCGALVTHPGRVVADSAINITPAPPSGCDNGSLSYCYTPSQSSAHAGSPVSWENLSGVGHTVTVYRGLGTQTTGTDNFDLGVSPHATVSFTFSNSGGTYTYYCRIHGYTAMHAVIQVSNMGGLPPPGIRAPAPGSAAQGGVGQGAPGVATSPLAGPASTPTPRPLGVATPNPSPSEAGASPSAPPSFAADVPGASTSPRAAVGAVNPARSPSGGSAAPLIVIAALVALLAGAGAGWWWWRRRHPRLAPSPQLEAP